MDLFSCVFRTQQHLKITRILESIAVETIFCRLDLSDESHSNQKMKKIISVVLMFYYIYDPIEYITEFCILNRLYGKQMYLMKYKMKMKVEHQPIIISIHLHLNNKNSHRNMFGFIRSFLILGFFLDRVRLMCNVIITTG